MLNHNGFHFGKLGLWDPRTDMVIFDIDEIKKQGNDLLIPQFEDWVYRHEKHHRGFYNHTSVMDIASYVFAVNFLLDRKSSDKEKIILNDILQNNIRRAHLMMNEIDPMLDAYLVLEMQYDDNKLGFDDDAFSKMLSANLNEKSEKIYYELEWLFDKSQEICGSAQILPEYVMNYSLNVGLNPFVRVYPEPESIWPQEMFQSTVNTLKDLYEANDKIASKIFMKIKKRKESPLEEKHSLTVEIANEIARYQPITKYNNLWENFQQSEIRNYYHDIFMSEIFGKNFSKLNRIQLMEQGFLIWVTQDGQEIDYRGKKKLTGKTSSHRRFILEHLNLAYTHAQDCIFAGKKVECFLCKCGFEICDDKFHKEVEEFSDRFNEFLKPC